MKTWLGKGLLVLGLGALLGVGACTMSTYKFGLFNNEQDYRASMLAHERAWARRFGRPRLTRAQLATLMQDYEGHCEANYRPREALYSYRPCGPSRLGRPVTICSVPRPGRLPFDIKGFGWHLMLEPDADGYRVLEMDRWNPARAEWESASCHAERPWGHSADEDWPAPKGWDAPARMR